MARIRNANFRSPRHLLFRHGQRVLKAQTAKDPAPDNVPAGSERLISYYIPLQAGEHTITVKQDIQPSPASGPPNPETVTTQMFDVVAAQFSLPTNAIHSTYPPQGQQEPAETLPHIVFNDPTFPWERVGGWLEEKNPPVDFDRNRTPWVAVLVFTQDEVKLGDDYLPGGTRSIFPKGVEVKTSSTFAINLPVSMLPNLDTNLVALASAKPASATDPAATTDIAFVNRDLFTGLFMERDSLGQPTATWTKHACVTQHRFLAHRRDINTQGMAVSGSATEDDSGSFGVVLSNRSGPFNISVPTAVFVHLVSIEGIEQMTCWPIPTSIEFVALPSLYSWSYICLPPDVPNIEDEFKNLGSGLNLLKPTWTNADASKMPPVDDPIGLRIIRRLEDGYTLSRYRTQTGETTVCFTRGPFVPSDVTPLPKWWPSTSMVGTDLQILDQELGIMDVSYSVAWQVGRAMAIADQSFTTALYRVRRQILQIAISMSQTAAVTDAGTHFKDRAGLLKSLNGMLEGLHGLKLAAVDESDKAMLNRWSRKAVEPLDLAYHGPIITPVIYDAIVGAALMVAGTPDPKNPTEPTPIPMYDEYNTPFSTDWVVVLKWVLDRLFLSGVPAQYLLTDASHLPPESLRFFKIDQNWVIALIDGALSFGNHVDQEFDPVRYGIKYAVGKFLSTPNSKLHYLHPVPQYGCYVRSQLIAKFPDMIVQTVPEPDPASAASPVLLSHNIVDDGTMLCLFSMPPSSLTFNLLKFTQPPHQQTFIVGGKLKPDTLTMTYRKAYTLANPPSTEDVQADLVPQITWHRDTPNNDPAVPYLWTAPDPMSQAQVNLHMLLTDNLATHYLATLQAHMCTDPKGQKYFDDTMASSALIAYQCNNPSWLLHIAAPNSSAPGALSPPDPNATFPLNPPPRKPTPNPRPTKGNDPGAVVRAGGSMTKKAPITATKPVRLRTRTRPIRNVVPYTTAKPRPNPTAAVAQYPQYRYLFWSADKPGTPDNPVPIPMRQDKVPQDLIFGIRLMSNHFNYKMQKIEISIPLGDPKINPNTLTKTYTGTDPAMLSNLRATPLALHSTATNELVIRLFPRSTEIPPGEKVPDIPVAQCLDLSFILFGVTVNLVDKDKVKIAPTICEYYTDEDVQTPQEYPPVIILAREQPTKE